MCFNDDDSDDDDGDDGDIIGCVTGVILIMMMV